LVPFSVPYPAGLAKRGHRGQARLESESDRGIHLLRRRLRLGPVGLAVVPVSDHIVGLVSDHSWSGIRSYYGRDRNPFWHRGPRIDADPQRNRGPTLPWEPEGVWCSGWTGDAGGQV